MRKGNSVTARDKLKKLTSVQAEFVNLLYADYFLFLS